MIHGAIFSSVRPAYERAAPPALSHHRLRGLRDLGGRPAAQGPSFRLRPGCQPGK